MGITEFNNLKLPCLRGYYSFRVIRVLYYIYAIKYETIVAFQVSNSTFIGENGKNSQNGTWEFPLMNEV